MAYSMDLRQRVIDDCDAGLGTKAVAQKYSVSPAWVSRLKQHRRERGDIRPRVGTSRRPTMDHDRLMALVAEQPDATLIELRDRLGVAVTPPGDQQGAGPIEADLKKRRSTPPSKTTMILPSVGPAGVSNS